MLNIPNNKGIEFYSCEYMVIESKQGIRHTIYVPK